MSVPRLLPDSNTIPNPPICRSADDETKHCEFAAHCNEARQRIQSGYERREGKWLRISGDEMWGQACWAFVGFRSRKMSSSREPVAAASPAREPGEEPF